MPDTYRAYAYKLELMVLDFDDVGIDEIQDMIEHARYPGRSISPRVLYADSRAIEWHDDHPLNNRYTRDQAWIDLFSSSDAVCISRFARELAHAASAHLLSVAYYLEGYAAGRRIGEELTTKDFVKNKMVTLGRGETVIGACENVVLLAVDGNKYDAGECLLAGLYSIDDPAVRLWLIVESREVAKMLSDVVLAAGEFAESKRD